MQVTRAGEYGVLGLLNLARRQAGQVVMIDEVSREEDIPRSFLAKIFQSLARAGIVRSNRGTRGGFALAKQPEQITTLEIIEAIEGRIALQRCLQAPAECPQAGGCPLCGLLATAQHQVREVFSRTTLADLMKTRRQTQASSQPAPDGTTPAKPWTASPAKIALPELARPALHPALSQTGGAAPRKPNPRTISARA
jgi:Rrf2 family transcriptional regulator, iron-sulfur cluster assembly transcription factor